MTGQGIERRQASKERLLAGEVRGQDWLEHGKKESWQGGLTNWRRQRPGLVIIQKESELARGTHKLERVEVRTGQDTER